MFEYDHYLVLGKSRKYRVKKQGKKKQLISCFLGDRNEKIKNQIKQMMDVSRVWFFIYRVL
jgi:hypothetical protein